MFRIFSALSMQDIILPSSIEGRGKRKIVGDMKDKKQMVRVRRTILAGRSGRSSRGRQYRLGGAKGPGRRMSTKAMSPEPPNILRSQSRLESSMKDGVSHGQDLQALKEQARAIEDRLRLLENRIRNVEPGSTPSVLKAFVDPVMCVGCGTCQDVCPAGAISVEEIARVDTKRCIGCGGCVEQCPTGALALHPLISGYKEPARVTL